MVSFRSIPVTICAALLLAGLGTSVRADEAPRSPNLLLVIVEGLDNVGVPAEGLEGVLFDPEVRARATPNLERLVALGARFDKAYAGAADSAASDLRGLLAKASDPEQPAVELVKAGEVDPPPHDKIRGKWPSSARQTRRRWTKLVPDDPSVANWERLAESQEAIATASAAAEAIGAPTANNIPRVLVAQLTNGATPFVPGVFFDRFPIDQIRIPEAPNERRALAERMGAFDFGAADLSEEDELAWKESIQAWLAGASALDYAVGEIVDAIEKANSQGDEATPWAVALIAPPAEPPTQQAVGELGARVGLVIVAPGVTKPGHRVATPVELAGLERTLNELVGADPQPDTPTDESYLPLFAPAGDRYDVVAVTRSDGAYGVRSHRFRLVHNEDSQSLYDLEKDPEGFYDLLNANNTAMTERFGLTSTQVEALRRWHTRQLYYRMAKGGAEAALLDKLVGLADLGPDHKNNAKPPAVLPGDYNRDGRVDAADTTIWRDHNGKEVPVGSGADGDFDGRVDEQDNIIWRTNYGRRAEAP